jgi:hypothetical protein
MPGVGGIRRFHGSLSIYNILVYLEEEEKE